MTRWLAGALLLLAGGCKTRLLTLGDDAGPPDLAAFDLAVDLLQVDLATLDLLKDCPPEAKLVYVFDHNSRMLSSFRPDLLVFSDIAALACPAPSTFSPESMAVQRDGTAWVEYTDGNSALVYQIDVKTGACDPTEHTPTGITNFGMAIVVDANDQEQLYAMGPGPAGDELGTLDLTSFAFSPHGTTDGEGDLTSDAAGHLYAFIPNWTGGHARVEDLDKSSGTALQTWLLPQIDSFLGAVAIAAWGGQLWLFVSQSANSATTQVLRLDPATGNVSTVISNTHRNIVGAGVAPCNP